MAKKSKKDMAKMTKLEMIDKFIEYHKVIDRTELMLIDYAKKHPDKVPRTYQQLIKDREERIKEWGLPPFINNNHLKD